MQFWLVLRMQTLGSSGHSEVFPCCLKVEVRLSSPPAGRSDLGEPAECSSSADSPQMAVCKKPVSLFAERLPALSLLLGI